MQVTEFLSRTNRLATVFFAVLTVLWALAPKAMAAASAQPPRGPARPDIARVLAGDLPTGMGDLRAMQDRIRKVAQRVMPCTVAVRIGASYGSGVIVSRDGYVLTAAHVIGKPGRNVTFTFGDGRTVAGKTLGVHRTADVGLMKITDKGKWPFVEMGTSADLKGGQWCLAAGHPEGYQSARRPVVRLGRILWQNQSLLTTDCTLVGGDSGGPLVDLDGKVIAIHSRIAVPLTANMHVPVDNYRDSWDRLVKGEMWGSVAASGPYLGVHGKPKADSAVITDVVDDSPAAKAGIRVSDVIVEFDGADVKDFPTLARLVRARQPGDKVSVTVLRQGKTVPLELVLGSVATPKGERTHFSGRVRVGSWSLTNQRNHPKVKVAFSDVVAKSSHATVRVLCNGRQVALGAAVDTEGHILTKASQLDGQIICMVRGGRSLPATVVGVSREHDLAMLHVAAKDLAPVRWSSSGAVPPIGSWVAAPGAGKTPAAIGVVSVAPRKIAAPKGVLGVVLGQAKAGPRVVEVLPDSSAARAGLRVNDIITAVNGKPTATRRALVDAVRQYHPGEVVRLLAKRGNNDTVIAAKLGRAPADARPGSHDSQHRMGGQLSDRRTGFPLVFQHDAVVRPTDCGGPLVDLDGNVVGINIARAGRVPNYAVPASVVLRLLAELRSGELAPTRPRNLTTKQKLAVLRAEIAQLEATLKWAEVAKIAARREVERSAIAVRKALVERAAAQLRKVEADGDTAEWMKAETARIAAVEAVRQAELPLDQAEAEGTAAEETIRQARTELERARITQAALQRDSSR